MSASTQDLERIRQLLLATYREIRSIVEHTPKASTADARIERHLVPRSEAVIHTRVSKPAF
jgi:hypothetical protein